MVHLFFCWTLHLPSQVFNSLFLFHLVTPGVTSVLLCSFSFYSGPFHLYCSPGLCNKVRSRAFHKHYFFLLLLSPEVQFPPYLFLPILEVPLAKMAAVLDSTCITSYSLFQLVPNLMVWTFPG